MQCINYPRAFSWIPWVFDICMNYYHLFEVGHILICYSSMAQVEIDYLEEFFKQLVYTKWKTDGDEVFLNQLAVGLSLRYALYQFKLCR